MSIGPSRTRIALAFVDDLLHDFQTTPNQSQKQPFPRTTQQIFQRVLVVAGGSARCVSVHVCHTLLHAVGFYPSQRLRQLPSPAKPVNEQQAAQLLGLIVEYAVCEGGRERSEVEIRGAQTLFDSLVTSICEHVLEEDRDQVQDIEERLLTRVLANVDQPYQCVFLCCLGPAVPILRSVVEVQLLHYLTFFVSKNTSKCDFRIDFLIRLLGCFFSHEFPSVDPNLVRSFLNKVSDEYDTYRPLLQPFVRLVLHRVFKVPFSVEEAHLKSEIEKYLTTADIDLKELRAAMAAPNYNMLCMALQEAGGACTNSPDTLMAAIKKSGLFDPALIGPSTVANAIVMMVRTSASTVPSQSVTASWDRAGSAAVADFDPTTPQQWNGRVFAKVMHSLNPSLNWSEVILRLDQESFLVRDRNSLLVLTQLLAEAFALNSAPFPVSFLYREWNFHRMGQLSWLHQITLNNDVFCVSDYPHTPVNLSCLKVQPEEGNKEAVTWRCLNLIETLLKMCDNSPTLTQHVLKVFRPALTAFPDIILLGIVQLSGPISNLRQHLVTVLIPMLLGAHPNAVPVLNAAWNMEGPAKNQIHQYILTALVNFWQTGNEDIVKLTKVLEIGHELKPSGLTELLNLKKFNFTMDLACLASKRDFLKLDKWLEDKYKEHGEVFVQSVIAHLKRRLPMGVVAGGTVNYLSQETYAIVHAFLNNKATVSQSVRVEYALLVSQLRELQGKSRNTPNQSDFVLLQMKSGEGGRSSSVSSQGRVPVGGGGGPLPVAPPGGPPGGGANMYGGGLPGAPPLNLGGFGGPAGFGGNSLFPRQENAPLPGMAPSGLPTPPGPGLNLLTQMSMSPSNQMMQSNVPGGGQRPPQRQNSNTGWPNIPAPGAMRSTPGATTPQGAIDFLPQLPPTQGSDLQAAPRAAPPSSTFPNEDLTQILFSEEVQDEANTYFEQIYSPPGNAGNLTVTDLLLRLKRFQLSTVPREREVLACVVKNLFEEYRFFPDYPERELCTTAEVYGGIIREGIITNLQFATAVRKVIESLQAEPNSKLWTFGLLALNACKKKLCCYPKVCAMIMQHENFSRFPQTLVSYVRAGVSEKLPPASATGRETPPWQASPATPQRNHSGDGQRAGAPGVPPGRAGTSVLSYTNVDTLVQATEKDGAEVEKPVEAILDKVSFLFNNLSQSNLQQKTDEMRGMIRDNGEKFVRWLAQYIVMKRVSIEQNFQPLYNNFVQAIEDSLLDKYIKMETFRNIKILLRSDKRQAASNYSDRQLLKNLGLWLGAITIARSRPITVAELDLKSLLMEAYYKGQQELLFVVPFIAKILTSCGKTSIFSPTSAWIKSILKILAELHNEPDLKINLKFEIEVLCKELSVDLAGLPIDGVLKDTDRLLRLPQQLSDLKMLQQPDHTASSPVPSQMRIGGGPSSGGTNTPQEMSAHSVGGTDTKPSTPLPGAESSTDTVESGPAPPHFAYHDINVVSFDGLVPHLKIPAQHPLFQLHPQLKNVIKTSINHAIKELIGPVTERALKVAMTVTEHVVKKDFAFDGDDQKMRKAGHHMMRAMTAGMAAITCREPLQTALITYLNQGFQQSLRSASSVPDSKLIEDAAMVVMTENLELATNFIVKTACEKATPELDKRLEAELTSRANLRREGKEFTGDQATIAAQNIVPDRIRLRPAPITKEQMAVYEEFSTKICGFKPTAANDMIPDFAGSKSNAAGFGVMINENTDFDAFANILLTLARECDKMLGHQPAPQNKAYQAIQSIRDLIAQLSGSIRNPVYLHNLIQRTVEQFLYAYRKTPSEEEWPRRLRELLFNGIVRALMLCTTVSELAKRVVSVITTCQLEYRFNVDAIETLYRQQLIPPSIFDQHLAQAMESSSNFDVAMFAQQLIKALSTDFREAILRERFPLVLDQLQKLQSFGPVPRAPGSRPTPDSTAAPSPSAGFPDRATAAGLSSNYSSGSAGTPVTGGGGALEGGAQGGDNSELQTKVEVILREWISLCYTPMAQRDPQQALATMIHMMHEHGVLATDEMITRFFRLCTEMCVDVSYRLLKVETASQANTVVRQRCYYTLDAFVKLTCLMVKHSDGSQHQTKINLLKKVLNIVTTVLLLDHEVRRAEFHAMPYHRILIIMFNELTQPDPALEPIAWPILEAFGQALFVLQPRRAPRFAYAWLDIVGHRNVIARLLGVRPGEGTEFVDPLKTSAMYTQLIICHLKFLAPFLRNIELPKSIAVLYKGTLRVLLVVLHDFPELLCEYHYVICDTIPPNCVQLRNLVLSAYPRNMRLPDPFALSFKQVDTIAEMAVEPKMNLNMASIIPVELRQQLDSYLQNRSSIELLSALPNMLQVSSTPGSKYNTTVLNAVVLYVGMRAIDAIHTRGQRISMTTIAHTAFMDIFQNLAVRLCTEGRYLLFNAIANQLRYPNAHTHYFSCTLLFLFQQADMNVMKEQITRILFERLVALRPHPWGLLITFIELIRNPVFNFWSHEFTRCAPEIERLFRNVAHTCISAGQEVRPV